MQINVALVFSQSHFKTQVFKFDWVVKFNIENLKKLTKLGKN